MASQYYYSRDQVIFAGPCWDYDQSCGVATAYAYNSKIPKRLDMQVRMDPDYDIPWNRTLLLEKSYRDMVSKEFLENRRLFYR